MAPQMSLGAWLAMQGPGHFLIRANGLMNRRCSVDVGGTEWAWSGRTSAKIADNAVDSAAWKELAAPCKGGRGCRQGQGLGKDRGEQSRDGDPDDNGLLHAVAGGDCAAFRRLMEKHAGSLLALATRMTGNGADADDIVQEAFLKVWTMAPRWQADGRARFSTWMYRVVLNASLDVRRRKKMSPLDEAVERAGEAADGFDHAMARQREVMVREAMAELPRRQRAALSLYYFGEISAAEAARVLGLSVSAMEALLVRGKRGLKLALARRGVTGLGELT